MVWSDLGRNGDALRLGPADDLHAAGGRDVRDVDPRAGVPGEHHVPSHDGLLGDPWPAGQSEPAGQLTFVRARCAVGKPRILGMLRNDAVKSPDVFQRAPHQLCVVHARAVVGEHSDARPGPGHKTEFGQLMASAILGDRTDGVDVDVPRPLAQIVDALGGLGRIGHRRGVGHGKDRREASQGCGATPGLDRFTVFAPRFPQVGMQIDQSRQSHQPVGAQPGRSTRRAGARLRTGGHDDAVGDEHITGAVASEVSPRDQQRARTLRWEAGGAGCCVHTVTPSPASRWYRTDMRTATPADTCSRTNDWAASAASPLISKPRFIGPGWQITACSGSAAKRRFVSP